MSDHLQAVLLLPDAEAVAASYRLAAESWERRGTPAVAATPATGITGSRYEGAQLESNLRDYLTHRVSDGARFFIRYVAQATKAKGGQASSSDVRQYAGITVQQQGGYGQSINSADEHGYPPPFKRTDTGKEWTFEMEADVADAIMQMVDTRGNLI